MTERGRGSLRRTPASLAIGPSGLDFDGRKLVVEIDEWTVPMPRRLRGRATVDLGRVFAQTHYIDAAGRHRWGPVAPCATVDVEFDRPGIGWQGRAYVDMNEGGEPLEAGFSRWSWSRQERGEATRILYDTVCRDGSSRSLALDYHCDGTVEVVRPDPVQVLPRTRWLVGRATRSPAERPLRVVRTLEDTPFYSRSQLSGSDGGGTIHESVDLRRFASPVVQAMLPFKMPRRA
jgi:carotenoid 1,2-hydratase